MKLDLDSIVVVVADKKGFVGIVGSVAGFRVVVSVVAVAVEGIGLAEMVIVLHLASSGGCLIFERVGQLLH